ncbi:rhoGAP domain-containing protein [Hirsutella rhossiliensis]|uniref:RhoGAP domain-containing protein n=1 Tax=Hirsutella rhossiliensis TaxID=111463 RepID=A0A9P8MS05_9HYPO|nr:rhoGAP domain-containing protein [Hirsutella rhossiliensis]KAH0959141.1 rhoGAP domain-containing protein [Hirsutella rhossiliensis]
MASAIPTAHRANNQAPPPGATPASPPNKRDLKSWWKSFKLPSKHQEPSAESKAPGIFGVPLRQSITYANVAISLIDENGQSYIYGYVPIVVAKCGVFLKEKATGIEGIFRLSGSEKRIKELKHIFDSPDRYGKGLVWDGYTVHDAANVLRRYLNDLPEPVVPLDLYEKFRDPLRGATKQAVGDAEGPQFVDNFDEKAAIEKYQKLITELPPLNRQLLLYILDLLAVFAAKSDENRMNSQNLAAIFQPGMLSHPTHAMAPEEYRLNQCVLIFLIENQDHFLIGMQGTAADEKTMKEVASGTPTGPLTPNPNRTSGLDRSSSNASAGATSVRRDGKVRRNRSVSSRHSRQEGNATPSSPSLATTPTGGLGRSNTVPSKKSPALAGAKFKRNDGPGHQSPGYLEPMTPVRPAQRANHSQRSSPTPATLGAASLPLALGSASGLSQERLLEVPQETSTPQGKERNLQSLFQRSPGEGGERRQPNKLKKKRISGMNISAQSSSASLVHSNAVSPAVEAANPMETMQPIPEPVSLPAPDAPSQLATEPSPSTSQATAAALAVQRGHAYPSPTQAGERSSDHTPRASYVPANSNLHPDNLLRGKKSPPTSVHSSFNEGSDLDQSTDDMPAPLSENSEREKKKRWRLSRSRKEDNGSTSSLATPPHLNIGTNDNAEISTTSIGSGVSKPRNSVTNEGSEPTTLASVEGQTSQEGGRDNGKDDAKGPIGWIRNKYREAKESAEQRRNKSPPADRQALGAAFLSRGRSLDLKCDRVDERQPEREAIAEKEVHEPPALKEATLRTPVAAAAAASSGAHAETQKHIAVDASKEASTEASEEPRAEPPPAAQPEPAPATMTEAQAPTEPPRNE